MQAIIDEKGRVEIPREFRDRMRMVAGAVVNLEPTENGLQITTVDQDNSTDSAQGQLVWEGTLLVYHRPGVTTVEDVNQAVELGRQQRFERIISNTSSG